MLSNGPHLLLSLFLFVSISLSGSYVFFRMRIPAGTIIGPIFLFTVLQVVGFRPDIPPHADTVMISIFGVYFATRMRGVVDLRKASLILPLLFTIVWFIAQVFASSFVLRQLMDIEPVNAFLSVIPGGIAEMNIVTLSYGANVSLINTFHLARLFSIILLVPLILKTAYKGRIQSTARAMERFFPRTHDQPHVPRLALTFAVGAIGSVVFELLDVPAGGLMGSLFFVVAFEAVSKYRETPPKNLYVVIVSLLGGAIGLNTDIETFRHITQLLVPIAITTAITLFGAALLAAVIRAATGKEYLATLLGVMPGGLTVMMSIAESATDDLFYVTSLQTLRLLTAVVILPNLLLVAGFIVPQ